MLSENGIWIDDFLAKVTDSAELEGGPPQSDASGRYMFEMFFVVVFLCFYLAKRGNSSSVHRIHFCDFFALSEKKCNEGLFTFSSGVVIFAGESVGKKGLPRKRYMLARPCPSSGIGTFCFVMNTETLRAGFSSTMAGVFSRQ